MWAVVINVDINDAVAAKQGLDEQMLPTIRQAPGFVGGSWVLLDERHGTSIAVFETQEQARAGLPEKGATAPGVTMTNVEVGEVLAHE